MAAREVMRELSSSRNRPEAGSREKLLLVFPPSSWKVIVSSGLSRAVTMPRMVPFGTVSSMEKVWPFSTGAELMSMGCRFSPGMTLVIPLPGTSHPTEK